MRSKIVGCVAMLVGLVAIVSSWWSIHPAANYRYEKMIEQFESDPESISNDALVQSDSEETTTALLLICVGGISFIISTVTTLLILLGIDVKKFNIVIYSLSITWILLGGALHAFVWLL